MTTFLVDEIVFERIIVCQKIFVEELEGCQGLDWDNWCWRDMHD